VQRHHLESPLVSIGDAKINIECGTPGRSHDLAVKLVDQDAVGASGAPLREGSCRRLAFHERLGLGIGADMASKKAHEAESSYEAGITGVALTGVALCAQRRARAGLRARARSQRLHRL